MKIILASTFLALIFLGATNTAFADSNSTSSFNTSWKIPQDSLTLTIPVVTSGDYTVDWGDNSTVEDFKATQATHTYDKAALYKVKMNGDISHIDFYNTSPDAHKLLLVDQWGDIQWSSMKNMFHVAQNMHIKATDVPDLSHVTDMSWMFYGAIHLVGNFSNWDVSNVTNMSNLFYNALYFDGNISTWDVSSVTKMNHMFHNAISFNHDISNWDVSSVTNMSGMFENSAFNQSLSKWDVSNVINMNDLFSGAFYFNRNISTWDTSSVIEMNSMFNQAKSFNQDISNWDITNVLDMENMLTDATSFSTENYDKMLISFNQQDVQYDVKLNSNSKYCAGGGIAKNMLVVKFDWNINDLGLDDDGKCNKIDKSLSFSNVMIKSKLNDNCLDIDSGVIGWDCDGGLNQLWSFDFETGEIKSALNDKCLSITSGTPRDGGANVVMWDCLGEGNQAWILHFKTGEIRAALHDNCLDIDSGFNDRGDPVILWDCHGGKSQQWYLQNQP